jgi:hypothetical protein
VEEEHGQLNKLKYENRKLNLHEITKDEFIKSMNSMFPPGFQIIDENEDLELMVKKFNSKTGTLTTRAQKKSPDYFINKGETNNWYLIDASEDMYVYELDKSMSGEINEKYNRCGQRLMYIYPDDKITSFEIDT